MSTLNRPNPQSIAESLHSAAIHLLRKLRHLDNVPNPEAQFLNAARLSALSVIVFAGPITLGHLADAEQVRPPTMTRIVHALQKMQLVTKTASANDRRTIHLSATMKGKRLLLLARNRRTQSLARQITALSAHDRKTLTAAIAILNGLNRAL
jgi:DNA-binding MarR family transcriptional regulator